MNSAPGNLIKRLSLVAILATLIFAAAPVTAQPLPYAYPVTIYLFYGDGCPHCAIAKPYLEGLQQRFPGLTVISYEVYYNAENQELFVKMAQKFGMEQLAVPAFFIGPYYQLGYSVELNSDIEAAVDYCLQNGCPDAGAGVLDIAGVTDPSTEHLSTDTADPQAVANAPIGAPGSINEGLTIEFPLLGAVDLSVQSTVLSTILIALVDGFNPCSLWVLSMLLALTIHTGSRKRTLIIGLVFLTVTAAIYALFIAGLFSVLKITSFMGWIQVVVAMIALLFAIVNIKDYFWFKENVSLTISDKSKPELFQKMRRVVDASQSLWGVIGATIILAVGVSVVEFSCTAGFPVLWTNLLTAQNTGASTFILLLVLYMLIYQLDELVIFSTAVVTLKATRFEEKKGRMLKLLGGMLMLTLSTIMLIDPALMNNLRSSLLIFGVAFLATLLVLVIHRILLPKIGIRIGTEFNKKRKR